jgi:glycosyltransferase involved in cell wall biosynthesis
MSKHRRMRIAIVYDCLYPYTVGGAERRYATVLAQLAQRHTVTYLTRRQWPRDATVSAPPGARVVAVSGGRHLYCASGRRKILPPLRFGWGVFWYLLHHRRDFDVVHTCSFPFFSLIAARLACALGGPAVVADWYEVWTRRYWREYLGAGIGRIGAAVQSLCVRLTQTAFVFSELHAARLREEGYRGHPILLRGSYDGPRAGTEAGNGRDPLIVYIGRHIPEKHVAAIPAAVAHARTRIPGLRAIIFGDGPERPRVLGEVERLGLHDVIDCPGFAPWERVDTALRRAMCLLLPSRREGFGLGVVEALARGTPAVIVRGPDNAATELIEDGQNGFIADSADPAVLARALDAVHEAGPALLARTRAWFSANAGWLGIDASILELEAVYAEAAGGVFPRPSPQRVPALPRALAPRRVREPVAMEAATALGRDDGPRV